MKKAVVFLFFILALGLILRLVNLTILPVFADEAIYIRWSQIMANEPTLRFLPMSDGKQPLFMWILMFVINRFSDPLFAGRLISVFTGIGTLMGIFAVTFLLFKSRLAALVSSFIWAISPYALFFDRIALVDSMLTMFGIWTFFFAVKTSKTLRLDYAMFTGFALGGAMLTKSPALFFLILLPLTWHLSKWPTRTRSRIIHFIKLSFIFLFPVFISQVMYNILRLGPNFHLINSRNLDYVYPISHIFENWRDPLISHLGMFWDWLVKLGPWPLVILALVGIATRINKYKKELFVVWCIFLVPVLIQSEYAKVFASRYTFFSMPFLAILGGKAFVWSRKTSGLAKKSVVLTGMLFVILSFVSDFDLLTNPAKANLPESERNGYLEEWTSGIGIKEVAGYIKTETAENPGKSIVVGTEGYFGTLPDGLQMYLQGVPNVTVIGVGIDLKEVPSSLTDSLKAGNKTYLVINKSRLLMDAESNGLMLISAYPKEPRTLGTWHFNLKGPQEVLYLFKVTDGTST